MGACVRVAVGLGAPVGEEAEGRVHVCAGQRQHEQRERRQQPTIARGTM